jgi:TolB-like protein/class 3 adenylate cyclase/Tfp pilus assembly protein PilF
MERKLTAILYADVAGYSRLTGADEKGTFESLKVRLALLTGAIERHGGRIVNTAGDAVLSEFASVVTALECAVAAQRELADRDKDIPAPRKLQFRIGVNLGDVIVDEPEIYGDGVNVAARLEALADAGGICISRRVLEQVERNVDVGFAFLGKQKVKNIERPINVYKVLLDPEDAGKIIDLQKPKPPRWRWPAAAAVALLILALGGIAHWQRPGPPEFERAAVEKMAFPLPDKPSIAVLPFDNLSGDPDQEFLADGLSEEIITTLSKVPHLFVIARNSTFTYKGKAVSVKKVAEEQGVRYVLEGSVQTAGDRIRINAQLIDALQGHHIWAERYDRQADDLFALQDDITKNIIVAVQVKLTSGEEAHIRARCLVNVEAFQLLYKGYWHYRLFNKEDVAKARELAQQAQKISPNCTLPLQLEAWSHAVESRFGWSASREESLRKAEALAEKSLAMDESNPDPENYMLLGGIAFARRQHDEAIRYAEKAIELMPSHSTAVANLGLWSAYAGRPEEGIAAVQKAMRLSPYYPGWYLPTIGLAYMMTERYDEAIAAYEESIKRNVLVLFSYERLAAIHAMKGDLEKAKEYAAKVLEINPKFTIEGWTKVLRYKNPEDLDRELDALRAAGLPEKPPLALPDKPSIAVLPFDNLSGDPEDQFLADGLTEDIITTLSRVPSLFVIARNSTFTYKGTPVKVQQVAAELGVRYVLEGSVQRSGERLRVTAQFIDATTGQHLWANRFDRKVDDIFALQDEIAHKILIELQVKLTTGEHARVASRGTKSLEAWLLRLQAFAEGSKYTKEGMLKARELLWAATKADPNYARAWGGVAWTHWFEARMGGWDDTREEALGKGIKFAERAIKIDPNDTNGYMQLANLSAVMGEHDRAVAYAQQAATLASNDYQTTAVLGTMFVWADEPERAIELFEQAKLLSPKYPAWIDWTEGLAQLIAGRQEEAITTLERGIERTPKSVWPRGRLVAAYIEADRLDEAKAEAAELLKIHPSFKVSSYVDGHLFKNPARKEWLRDLLLKAGLPEGKSS